MRPSSFSTHSLSQVEPRRRGADRGPPDRPVGAAGRGHQGFACDPLSKRDLLLPHHRAGRNIHGEKPPSTGDREDSDHRERSTVRRSTVRHPAGSEAAFVPRSRGASLWTTSALRSGSFDAEEPSPRRDPPRARCTRSLRALRLPSVDLDPSDLATLPFGPNEEQRVRSQEGGIE